VALADYVARMKDGQERIYYVLAESRAAARARPVIERLRAQGVEVLLLGDRVDPWIMGQLQEFEGKPFQDAGRGDLELGKLADEADRQAEAAGEAHKDFFQRIREALGDAVGEVRASSRLTESPACLTRSEDDMGEQMRRILAAAGRDMPAGKPRLEVNLGHPLVARLEKTTGEDFTELAQLLFDQAQLTEQGQVANPGDYVRRLNRLLVKLVGAAG
jgi:molecular chaperone HtpG